MYTKFVYYYLFTYIPLRFISGLSTDELLLSILLDLFILGLDDSVHSDRAEAGIQK